VLTWHATSAPRNRVFSSLSIHRVSIEGSYIALPKKNYLQEGHERHRYRPYILQIRVWPTFLESCAVPRKRQGRLHWYVQSIYNDVNGQTQLDREKSTTYEDELRTLASVIAIRLTPVLLSKDTITLQQMGYA
jgi:hypothetical protein